MFLQMIFLIALALALDAFAVTAGIGASLRGLSVRASLRLAFHFGLFQFFMPLFGWLASERLVSLIEAYDHWIALLILSFVGARMIFSGLKKEKGKHYKQDPTRGWSLLSLAVATSLDALAVGFTLATLNLNILGAAAIIGLTAFCLTMAAAALSHYLGRLAGRWAEVLGGFILILIGWRIFLSHLG